MRYWKILSGDRSTHGGSYKWSLPANGRPGAWTPKEQPIICEQGWHVATDAGLFEWFQQAGHQPFSVETRGRKDTEPGDPNKVAFEQVRLTGRVQLGRETWALAALILTDRFPTGADAFDACVQEALHWISIGDMASAATALIDAQLIAQHVGGMSRVYGEDVSLAVVRRIDILPPFVAGTVQTPIEFQRVVRPVVLGGLQAAEETARAVGDAFEQQLTYK